MRSTPSVLAALFIGLLALTTPTPIQHVIVVVQNGRTFNNLFNGFPNGNTTTTGLTSLSIGSGQDPDHTHSGFVTAWDNGAQDGWPSNSKHYGPTDEAGYFSLAETYGTSVNTVQAGEGPAGPDHQVLIAGQEGSPAALIDLGSTNNYTCGVSATLSAVDMTTSFPGTSTTVTGCFTYKTILDEIETAGGTWNYYCSTDTTVWCAPFLISGIWNTPARKAHVIQPETTFLTDVAAGTLASLTYISPSFANSDAGGHTSSATSGRVWVTSIVNAVQATKFWGSTAIIVVWADWGGWYDNVCAGPSSSLGSLFSGIPNPYHYGCRVPMLVISPFAHPNYVDTTRRSTASILTFIEAVFNLPSLGTLDAYEPDALMPFFDWSRNRNWL